MANLSDAISIQQHQSCGDAFLAIPILACLSALYATMHVSGDLGLLGSVFWWLVVAGWVPVAIGYVQIVLARISARLLSVPTIRKNRPAFLPHITILLPVHNEANMMVQIAASMARLDYPADRLTCLVLLEADDRDTALAATCAQWPDFCRLLSVPQGVPMTKARACNYALRRARGDLLVIFDAEDQPHPKQLREAARRFARHDEKLACLQAPLYVVPKSDDWIQNHFALEYRLLFNFILPCIGRANGALPLGGSSNYFRLAALREVGGWDDFNLTEDADLGVRLAQHGYRTDTLKLPTYENAPHRLDIWHYQRTRWMSGHIQTLYVLAKNSFRQRKHWHLTLSCAAVLLGRLAAAPAHMSSIYFLATHMATPQSNPLTLAVFLLSYGVLVYLLYRLSHATTRRARLWFAVTHWLYWLCTFPALLNALKRMSMGQVNWLKSAHMPYASKMSITE